MTTPLRAVIADDHAATRADVRAILDGHPRFTVAAEAADAPGAVAAALEHRPDVCVLDVRMPGSGIAAAREISTRLPQTKVVMLTISEEDVDLFPALRAGASGYLLKDVSADRLPLALLDVIDGRAALPRQLLSRVFDDYHDRDPRRRAVHVDAPAADLTAREWQVIDLLRRGRSSDQVARALGVTTGTVRSHVMSLRRKLQAPDRRALVALFEEPAARRVERATDDLALESDHA